MAVTERKRHCQVNIITEDHLAEETKFGQDKIQPRQNSVKTKCGQDKIRSNWSRQNSVATNWGRDKIRSRKNPVQTKFGQDNTVETKYRQDKIRSRQKLLETKFDWDSLVHRTQSMPSLKVRREKGRWLDQNLSQLDFVLTAICLDRNLSGGHSLGHGRPNRANYPEEKVCVGSLLWHRGSLRQRITG